MNVKILGFLLLIITFLLLGYLLSYTGEVIEERKEARVVRVIDGDTIEVNISGTLEKVRLLDINTPEKGEFYYKEARDFLNRTLLGNVVYLEVKERDRYGRLLGYVFYNNELINEQIIEYGYGHFYSYEDSRYTDELKEAEEYARDNKIGIWQKSSSICSECIILADFDSGKGRDDCEAETEYAVFYNKCAQGCSLDGWNVKDRATHIYRFKNAVIDKDKKLILYNGIGEDNATSLFWQNKGCASLWNDDGDALFLRDSEGKLVLYYNY